MKSSNFDTILKRTNVRKINPAARMLNIALTIGDAVNPKGVSKFVKTKFFTPISKELTKDQEPWMMQAEQFRIPFKSEFIMAWKIGDGPSLVFAHGWNGRGIQFNHFFAPALEAGYSIIFFDAPGHGNSGGQMSNYLEFTAALDTLLNHEISKDTCAIIGHSLGTSAAINQRSEQKHTLPMVLVAPPFYLMELLFSSFQMHGVPKQIYLKLIQELEQVYQVRLENKNPIDLINRIDNQVLIIHDKTDRTTPIGPCEEVANRYANVELYKTDGYGHSLLLRQDFVVAKALDFIGQNRAQEENIEELCDASV